jgi:hypothetical protein
VVHVLPGVGHEGGLNPDFLPCHEEHRVLQTGVALQRRWEQDGGWTWQESSDLRKEVA